MIKVDLQQYANGNWGKNIKTISEISRFGDECMVESDGEMYCFDDIVSDIFPEDSKPASVDGISFEKNAVYLFEFKTGFYDRININNLDAEKAKCDKTGSVCGEYWRLFGKNRDQEKRMLRDSIRMKAIESYITLEKKIFPKCEKVNGSLSKIVYWVVIDSEPVNAEEDILGSLTEKGTPLSNEHEKIRQALKRFKLQKDEYGADYYYDEIKVLSASEFKVICRDRWG